MGCWQKWLEHPQKLKLHKILFQIHYAAGMMLSVYVLLMSVSGSIIVFRNELPHGVVAEWLVNFHGNLLSGKTGRLATGIGAFCVTMLCLTGIAIWWPGLKNWRRALSVDWRMSISRFGWDLHSALGFWIFPFLLMWGISGIYFAFPNYFSSVLAFFDPGDQYYDVVLLWLSNAHFGRFGWVTEVLWSTIGLAAALLSISGVFVCCHRMIFKKSANPYREMD